MAFVSSEESRTRHSCASPRERLRSRVRLLLSSSRPRGPLARQVSFRLMATTFISIGTRV